jgi:3-oxoadipate enol-lactonase
MTRILSVVADGLWFRCRLDGEGNGGPWIVTSNSLATDGRIWDAQVPILADRFRILRYDQRGHGGTTVPDGPCDFAQLGGDVLALLDHFAIASCTFVGLSMGVPTALQLWAHAAERIERLVLVDGQPESTPVSTAAWEERIAGARAHGMAAMADATVARWFQPATIAAGNAAQARDIIAATPLEGFVACARALQSYAFADVLPTITVPTLLIVGAGDGGMPATMARMRAHIAGASLVEIPGAGHLPNVEQPAAFNSALGGFLAGSDRA